MSAPGWREWLETRGAGVSSVRGFLAKPIPGNVSWIHTLGSLLLVYLVFQMLTGVLLGLYYSPGEESAYASVEHVRGSLLLGGLVHDLHRLGAGFVLVTAFLHMARSYFLAAYKPPRELLWASGLLLFGLLTLFAFTGQLLPWDQRGYWATVVGLRIVSSAPVVGEWLRDLLTGGYAELGTVTLSRFYLLHVSVLPLVLVPLAGVHLAILQRVGPAGPVDGGAASLQSFHPWQTYKDVLVAAGGALLLLVVALLVDFGDSGPADPTAPDFTPRPEWYFLAHYEVLRLLPGSLQLLGTFVLPAVLGAVLLLLPLLDRRAERAPRRRPVATGLGALACLGLVALTARGVAGAPERETSSVEAADPVARGRELFEVRECTRCHSIGGEGGDLGPALDHVGRRLQEDWMRAWIRNPRRFDPTTEMPSFEGTEDELQAIVSYLSSLD